MRKKISTTIYVTPEQADKLKLLHERTKVPVAVYIREGIDLVLRHYSHLLPGQLPLVDSTVDVTRAARDAKEAKGERGERGEREKDHAREEGEATSLVARRERASSANVTAERHADAEEKAVAKQR
jgi:hypothetical protein